METISNNFQIYKNIQGQNQGKSQEFQIFQADDCFNVQSQQTENNLQSNIDQTSILLQQQQQQQVQQQQQITNRDSQIQNNNNSQQNIQQQQTYSNYSASSSNIIFGINNSDLSTSSESQQNKIQENQKLKNQKQSSKPDQKQKNLKESKNKVKTKIQQDYLEKVQQNKQKVEESGENNNNNGNENDDDENDDEIKKKEKLIYKAERAQAYRDRQKNLESNLEKENEDFSIIFQEIRILHDQQLKQETLNKIQDCLSMFEDYTTEFIQQANNQQKMGIQKKRVYKKHGIEEKVDGSYKQQLAQQNRDAAKKSREMAKQKKQTLKILNQKFNQLKQQVLIQNSDLDKLFKQEEIQLQKQNKAKQSQQLENGQNLIKNSQQQQIQPDTLPNQLNISNLIKIKKDDDTKTKFEQLQQQQQQNNNHQICYEHYHQHQQQQQFENNNHEIKQDLQIDDNHHHHYFQNIILDENNDQTLQKQLNNNNIKVFDDNDFNHIILNNHNNNDNLQEEEQQQENKDEIDESSRKISNSNIFADQYCKMENCYIQDQHLYHDINNTNNNDHEQYCKIESCNIQNQHLYHDINENNNQEQYCKMENCNIQNQHSYHDINNNSNQLNNNNNHHSIYEESHQNNNHSLNNNNNYSNNINQINTDYFCKIENCEIKEKHFYHQININHTDEHNNNINNQQHQQHQQQQFQQQHYNNNNNHHNQQQEQQQQIYCKLENCLIQEKHYSHQTIYMDNTSSGQQYNNSNKNNNNNHSSEQNHNQNINIMDNIDYHNNISNNNNKSLSFNLQQQQQIYNQQQDHDHHNDDDNNHHHSDHEMVFCQIENCIIEGNHPLHYNNTQINTINNNIINNNGTYQNNTNNINNKNDVKIAESQQYQTYSIDTNSQKQSNEQANVLNQNKQLIQQQQQEFDNNTEINNLIQNNDNNNNQMQNEDQFQDFELEQEQEEEEENQQINQKQIQLSDIFDNDILESDSYNQHKSVFQNSNMDQNKINSNNNNNDGFNHNNNNFTQQQKHQQQQEQSDEQNDENINNSNIMHQQQQQQKPQNRRKNSNSQQNNINKGLIMFTMCIVAFIGIMTTNEGSAGYQFLQYGFTRQEPMTINRFEQKNDVYEQTYLIRLTSTKNTLNQLKCIDPVNQPTKEEKDTHEQCYELGLEYCNLLRQTGQEASKDLIIYSKMAKQFQKEGNYIIHDHLSGPYYNVLYAQFYNNDFQNIYETVRELYSEISDPIEKTGAKIMITFTDYTLHYIQYVEGVAKMIDIQKSTEALEQQQIEFDQAKFLIEQDIKYIQQRDPDSLYLDFSNYVYFNFVFKNWEFIKDEHENLLIQLDQAIERYIQKGLHHTFYYTDALKMKSEIVFEAHKDVKLALQLIDEAYKIEEQILDPKSQQIISTNRLRKKFWYWRLQECDIINQLSDEVMEKLEQYSEYHEHGKDCPIKHWEEEDAEFINLQESSFGFISVAH